MPEGTAAFRFGDRGPACLLLHGFTGSPWDLQPLATRLADAGFQGQVPLLPGHGISPADMAQASAADWLEAADRALDQETKRSGGPALLAGFSMGALLAIHLAAQRPSLVKALVLMAPAARLSGVGAHVARVLRHWPLVERLWPLQPKGEPDVEEPTARHAAPTWTHFPTALLRDLFVLQDSAEVASTKIRAPALLVLAPDDHVVSNASAKRLYRRLPGATDIVVLSRSFHGLARDYSGAELGHLVTRFFSQHA